MGSAMGLRRLAVAAAPGLTRLLALLLTLFAQKLGPGDVGTDARGHGLVGLG